MSWTEEQDDALCKQILVIEPFRYRLRTNQSGSVWSKIAGELNKMTSLQMKVDQRAVRDRFKTIKKKFQDKMKAEETGSGIAYPELTPVENAIEDIMERELEMEILHGEEDDEKNKRLEKDKKTAEDYNRWKLFQKPEREKLKIMMRMMKILSPRRLDGQAQLLCCTSKRKQRWILGLRKKNCS